MGELGAKLMNDRIKHFTNASNAFLESFRYCHIVKTLGKFKYCFGFFGELHLVSDKVDYILASVRPKADYHHNRVVATLNLCRRQNENPA